MELCEWVSPSSPLPRTFPFGIRAGALRAWPCSQGPVALEGPRGAPLAGRAPLAQHRGRRRAAWTSLLPGAVAPQCCYCALPRF